MSEILSRGHSTFEVALLAGHDNLAAVAHEVGASAAHMGSPLQEVLGGLERAYAAVRDQKPDVDVVASAAIAWSEIALDHQHQISCEDPLTTLVSLRHLRTRIDDVYRSAERDVHCVSDVHALLVVQLPPSSGANLSDSLDMLDAAHSLRTVFSGDESIAQVAKRRIVALVERERTGRVSIELVQILLRQGGAREPRVWIEGLPRSNEGVSWLLAELVRPG